MGVNRPSLPILGILLAVSGLVLSAFAFVDVSRIDSQVTNYFDQNSWYRYNNTNFNTDPIYTYLTITHLTVEFELEQGDSVYFSFSSSAHIEYNPTSWSRIFVYFRVDGIFQSDPTADVGIYQETVAHHFTIHLQAVRNDLSAGAHNVTVVIYGESTGNYIWKSSMFVQKVAS
ncbi:MAG: hypothetical protein ACFE9R_04900 [Candidatus Hermodarchaeota archaeon]